MTKAATAVLLALLATLALSASAGGKSAAPAVKILGTSHTHPAGKTYSWVCIKIRLKEGEVVKVRLSGPSGSRRPRTVRGPGTKIVKFKITSPGPYSFRVGRKSRSYNVPEPPDPANGPFSCVASPT